VLVVEDEFILAMSLEEDLKDGGFVVVGPFSSLAAGLGASASEAFDIAVLDINLNGEMVFPLADALSARGVPFVFVTGYGAAQLPERYRTANRIPKPYDPVALIAMVKRLCAG
jgi:DNA-binding response OmpR family regulator